MKGELNYIVVTISSLSGIISAQGGSALTNSRRSLNSEKAIFCINHNQDRVCAMFIADFDYLSFISGHDILTHEQAKELMNTIEWSEAL